MKKTLSINVSGIIFHIEEDGYETLRKYLDSINRYFSSFEDSSEIIADIENRIAEIFLSKLNEGKQVITAEDVSQLIVIMGNVNDFKAAEENDFAPGQPKKEPQPKSASATSEHKKLVRDQSRKVLGGVCAGLAHYFGIDPVWPRLIFALLTLGYGGGLLVYIILWIVLPVESLEEESGVKKMYRNPGSKVLGGVAGGIAAFFGSDVILIRVLFVILAFFGGFGILLYIILWISIPEAKTITEKMEMQGEPVTLSNIESSVKKSLNEKDTEESALAKIVLFPFRALAAILNFLAKILGPLFKVIVEVFRVMIGIVILLIGLSLVLSTLLGFGLLFGIISSSSLPGWWNLEGLSLPLDAIKSTFSLWTVVAAFLVALIPSLFIQLLGSSIIAKRIVFRPMIGWTLFVLFFVSVLVLGISLPRIILSFKEEGDYKVEKTFDVNGKTMVLKVNETGLDDYRVTDLTLKGYEGKQIKLMEHFQSQGNTHKNAIENAQMITYNVQQADSVITFDSNITFNKDAKFRAQRLEMDLYIPYNTTFVINEELWRLIDNSYHDYDGYRDSNFDKTWKMTDHGFECINCSQPTESKALELNDQFGLKGFDELDITGIFNMRIRQSDVYSIEIQGPESEKRKFRVDQSGDRLEIDYRSRNKTFWLKNMDEEPARITITLPSLSKLKVKGAGKIKVEGFREESMDISLLGAMTCDASLNARNLQLNLSGPMVFELDGDGDFLEAEVNKVAQLKAAGYEVRHAIVNAREMGRARVNARETVEIETDFTGSVKYQGHPEVIKKD
ncbi:MAG TPA: PspC domain-containing protein [Cyclobacteriaceae bacterium]|nr:PspC domain-containing protein [Cyclobacteriaceae bacterium]